MKVEVVGIQLFFRGTIEFGEKNLNKDRKEGKHDFK